MTIKLRRNIYAGTDVGYSQLFGEHPEWYAKFNLRGHNGVDVPIPTGTRLYCAINGTVTESAYDETGYGKYIKIENDECGILYAHLKTLSPIAVGTKVVAGQDIGESGNTGNSTGPHLHFGVFPKPRDRSNGYAGYIDPLGDQIEWVSELSNGEMEELKKQLEECLEEKNRYKLERNECRETRDKERYEYGKTLSEKDKMIEQYGKQTASLQSDLIGVRKIYNESRLEYDESIKLIDKIYEEIKD